MSYPSNRLVSTEERPYSFENIPGCYFDDVEYTEARRLISEAADLFGDGCGNELGLNPEYERGIAELIMRRMDIPVELKTEIIAEIHGTARDNAARL